MELYDLSDRYFKVTVIKIFTKIKKTLHEPSENFNKDIDNTKVPNRKHEAKEHSN